MKDNGKFLFLEPIDTAPAASASTEPCLEAEVEPTEALAVITRILCENELDPVTQLSGFLITDDPTYLPEGTEARTLARRIGRDRLLETLIEQYLNLDLTPPHADI